MLGTRALEFNLILLILSLDPEVITQWQFNVRDGNFIVEFTLQILCSTKTAVTSYVATMLR
jgi:hypothetical protein